MKRYDAIIIGTGQAGPSLAGRLTENGMEVAVIERKLFGGTCVNTGCIPTKTLIASAHAAHLARRAADFGVVVGGGVAVDMKRTKARKDYISALSRDGLAAWLGNMKKCTVYRNHARFESAHEVQVGTEVIGADRIFINVGARASVPPILGLDRVPYLTNSSMMEVDFLPGRLLIVGGGYVGIEFAQMYRRFGSEVTIIEMAPRLMHKEDEDVSQGVKEILEAEGIEVRVGAKCIAVEKQGNDVRMRVDCPDNPAESVGSHLLVAVGRRPNTDDLGLEKAGVLMDERGFITVDEELRTNVPGIWVLGDCNGRGAFTHTSYNDYEIVAANILDGEKRRVSDRITTYALYTDPPLGRAGLTETEVRASGRPALIAKRPMTRVGRAIEKGETKGFMKIIVDAQTEQILGAAILGTGGDEVIHTLLDVMYAKAHYTVVERAMHIHPTVSELIPIMLEELKPF
jgi:pyruvate/2-oxoglutarate dehydrogenase complex dihydrolipoamide dehydrogenase (E3) component